MPAPRRLRILVFAALVASPFLAARAGYNAGLAAFERGDFATAKEEFLPLANQGNADAQYAVALIALKQNPPNYSVAVPWLEKGARGGNADAQYFLGLLYQQGVGVTRNTDLAYRWLQKAVVQGHMGAFELMEGYTVPKQTKRAANPVQPAVSKTEGKAEKTYSPVKKSRNGICFDSVSQYYSAIKTYEPFNNMEECLESGGRPPH